MCKGWAVGAGSSLYGFLGGAPSKVSETLGLPHLRGADSWGVGPSLVLHPRLQQLDEENSELRSCTPCLKANIERLEEVSCHPGVLSGQGQALPCVDTEVSQADL